ILVLAVLVFVFVIRVAASASKHNTRQTIRRERQFQREAAKGLALAELRQRDPAFDEPAFLQRVSLAFVKIQHAWSEQNLAPARAFISDGIHERFSLQIEMQQAEGHRNLMENVRVSAAEVVAVYSDDQFDTLHVRFSASAVDTNVNLATGERIDGSGSAEPFVEFWSFHRRPGAKTRARPGAIEGNCPNCAAPLEIVDRALCHACGATVNSGEHDWVLAEITQEGEWELPDPHRRVPGLEEMQRHDPGFSVQHVEDRASVMYWRLMAALFYGDLGYARPVLAASLDRLPPLIAPDWNRFVKIPAVGKVEVVDVRSGGHGAPDRCRVLVRWSGRYFAGRPASPGEPLGPQQIHTQVFVLVRDAGVQTVAAQTFSSAHCPNCGAPIAVSKQSDCRFCGTVLNDGRHDWILQAVAAYTPDLWHWMHAESTRSTSERAVSPIFPSEGNGRAMNGQLDPELWLALVAHVVGVDGEIDARERMQLIRAGERRGLSPERIDLVLASVKNAELPVPEHRADAVACLEQMVRTGLADGQIAPAEKKLLYRFGEEMHLARADVKYAIRKEHRRLH
ncbi:MAG: TIM44-like domain-containing protein, partial [Planctomycetaceae bacterium]